MFIEFNINVYNNRLVLIDNMFGWMSASFSRVLSLYFACLTAIQTNVKTVKIKDTVPLADSTGDNVYISWLSNHIFIDPLTRMHWLYT